jgi:hypothetical protein
VNINNFANAGMVMMKEQAAGSGNTLFDAISLSGTFTGHTNSRLLVDAFVGGSGSRADLLTVGSSSGVTSTIIRDISTGAGAFNPEGIAFVTATTGRTALGEFVLDAASTNYERGVLQKGLFFFDIATRPEAAGARSQVLIGVPDQEVFELTRAVTGAQTIWHETAGIWLDRQVDVRDAVNSSERTQATVAPKIWGNIAGSWTDRSTPSIYSNYDREYTFDTSYKQDMMSIVAGIDFGRTETDGDGTALMAGIMGGYVASDLKFSSTSSAFNFEGGNLGVYGT